MVTDFHSHILPGIDDGSANVEESIRMLQMEASQGIRHVVATPHFYARYDAPEDFLKKRDAAEALLRERMGKLPGLPELSVGAEVYYFRGMSESEFLPRLTIQGKGCILIEMPQAPWTEESLREIEAIWTNRGILPIIAHIDRYIAPFRTHRIPEKLACMPVLVQANASFFLDRATSAMALRLLKADRIQLLGSDCHNAESRKPELGEAADLIRRKLGPEVLQRIAGYENRVLYD